MEIDLSDEQLAFAEAAQQMLTREWKGTDVRAAARPEGSGHSPELWQRIVDAGWLSLVFPEPVGGDGRSLVDLGVIVREAGRALVPTSFTSTLYAGLLLAELANDEQTERWLRPLVQGEVLATVAYAEAAAVHDPSLYETRVGRVADGWRLTGRKLFVENGSVSDLLVVACRSVLQPGGGEFALCLVDRAANGVTCEPHSTFGHDLQDEVVFDDVRVDAGSLLGSGGHALERWRHVTAIVTALTSLEMVGGAQEVLDRTVEYLTVRRAFGKPIGAFQAVQHLMANAAMAVKGAELAGWQAVWRLGAGRPATREVAIAKATAGRAYRDLTVAAHQVWGGNGFDEDNDLHLWSRRAVAADLRYGSAGWHIQQLADEIKR